MPEEPAKSKQEIAYTGISRPVHEIETRGQAALSDMYLKQRSQKEILRLCMHSYNHYRPHSGLSYCVPVIVISCRSASYLNSQRRGGRRAE